MTKGYGNGYTPLTTFTTSKERTQRLNELRQKEMSLIPIKVKGMGLLLQKHKLALRLRRLEGGKKKKLNPHPEKESLAWLCTIIYTEFSKGHAKKKSTGLLTQAREKGKITINWRTNRRLQREYRMQDGGSESKDEPLPERCHYGLSPKGDETPRLLTDPGWRV